MKFKALLFAFLATFGSVILTMDEPLSHGVQTAQTATQKPLSQDTQISVQKEINSDDVCPTCLRLAKDIPQQERCITNCCQKFICDTDAQKIIKAVEDARLKEDAEQFAQEEKARRKEEKDRREKESMRRILGNDALQEMNDILKRHNRLVEPEPQKTQQKVRRISICPYCSKELSTTKAFLKKGFIQKPVVEIIDAENNKFDLDQELSTALLQCGSFKMRDDALNTAGTAAPLDFSGVIPTQGRFLKQDLITKIAQLINDPINQTPNIPQTLEFFELANYLEAPGNILYIVANELWPLMQDKPNDAPHIKKYKECLRGVARPHLACPNNLLHYLQSIPASTVKQFKDALNQSELNFSFGAIKQNLQNHGWYQDNEQNWYKVYPFCSLDGITEMLTYLKIDTDSWRLQSFNLSNHFIETFSCDFSASIETLNLSNNNVKKLTGKQLHKREGSWLPRKIILTNNPINTLEESFFEALRKARTTSSNSCEISLENNTLSNAQKEEIRKKFYKATHTIPERYLNRSLFEKAFLYGGALAGIGAGLYAGNKLGNYAPNLMKNISVSASVAIGIIAGACREAYFHHGNESAPWFFFDVTAGATGAYFGSKKLFNYKPQATKVVPMAITGIAGALTGALVAKGTGNIVANGLARISHPKTPFSNTWSNGDYTLKL